MTSRDDTRGIRGANSCLRLFPALWSSRKEALEDLIRKSPNLFYNQNQALCYSEKRILCAVFKCAISGDNVVAIKPRMIADDVNIAPKNLYRYLDKLAEKQLIIVNRHNGEVTVSLPSPTHIQSYWVRNYMEPVDKAYGTCSLLASLADRFGSYNSSPLKIEYKGDKLFLPWIVHGVLIAKKQLVIIVKYFRSLLQFPLLGKALKKRVADGIDVVVVLSRETHKHKWTKVVQKIASIGATTKFATKPIHSRVMLIDEHAGMVNYRIENGERHGYFFGYSKEDYDNLWNDWVSDVFHSAREVEEFAKTEKRAGPVRCPDCGCLTDDLGTHWALSCPYTKDSSTAHL